MGSATVFLNTENCLIFASAEGKREVGMVRSLEKCEICAILVSFIDGFCGALSILDQNENLVRNISKCCQCESVAKTNSNCQ